MTDVLDTLLPDPRNARRHSQDNFDLYASSLREVGAARSIVIEDAVSISPRNIMLAWASARFR